MQASLLEGRESLILEREKASTVLDELTHNIDLLNKAIGIEQKKFETTNLKELQQNIQFVQNKISHLKNEDQRNL